MCRALARLNLASPHLPATAKLPAANPVVWLDDTGWRVGARAQNLRVLLSEQVTVYVIEPHRGYAEAAAILGEDYAGFPVHDGARCFYGFAQAFHQSCLEHRRGDSAQGETHLGGCCTTAMEPRSPPPLWPVSNAFSTPWTPHPVDKPARRATTSFPSRRKGHVLGQPPPIVGPSTPAA